MSVLLDTHIWIWWLTGAVQLKQAERRALDRAAAAGRLYLSAISMWEAQLLHSKQRLQLPLRFADWLVRATNPEMLLVVPLDSDIIIALDHLPAAFHGDPADRLIVATARTFGYRLATHDKVIRAARVVQLWKP